MDSLNKNDSANLASLMKKLSKSELTLILELLQNKTSGEIRTKLSELENTLNSISNMVHAMSEYDLMYWYCNIRSLATTLQQSEEQTLSKLKKIKSSYCCTKCRKDVVINYNMGVVGNLQSHSCNTYSPSLSGAAPLDVGVVKKLKEYELYQVVRYDNSMEEKLFYKVVVSSGKEIIYFYSIVYTEDEIIQCLVCDCDIPGKANVIQHVLGNRHKKTFQTDYNIILKFHMFFSNLEPKYQILLPNFHPTDERKAECLVCSNNLLFRNIKRHMSSSCFDVKDDLQGGLKISNITENQENMVVTKPSEGNMENVSAKSSGTKKCVSFKYDQLVENTIYQGLLEYNVVVDNINCPILQNIDSRIYCLLCNTNVTKHICIHIDSVPHQQNLSDNHTVQMLKKYHQIWTAQPVHIQIEQIYFRRREHKITCTVCSNFFHYNVSSLTQHVESIEHKRFLMKATEFRTSSLNSEKLTCRSASSRSASTETDRNTPLSTSSSSSNILNRTVTNSSVAADVLTPTLNSPIIGSLSETINLIPYDKSVLDELYPDGLIHFVVTIDSVKYPTIIKRETSKYCLLCNMDVTTTVMLHANSPQHIELSATDHRREKLKKFHNIWISLPQIDQCRQILFKTEEDLICSLCNRGMAYDVNQVRSHIESWDHVQKLMVMQTNGSFDDGQQHAIFSEGIRNGIIPNSQIKVSKDNICEETSTETTEKPRSLQDLLNGLKMSSSITESKPKVAVEKTSLNKMENLPTKSSGSVAYSKEILDELYGEELIHYHVRVDNIKYPFIQNMDTYKRCLICNIDLLSSILFHINSSPHVAMTNNPERIEQLKNYHDLWLNFSGSDQREQKYFEIGEKLTCSPCQKELEYNVEALTTHIFSTGHGNKTWILNNKSPTGLGKLSDTSCTVRGKTPYPSKDLIDFEDFPPVTEANPTVSELNEYPSLTRDLVTGSPPAYEHSLDVAVKPDSSMPYTESVLDTIYFDLTQYAIQVNDRIYPYIQHRLHKLYCLICKTELNSYAIINSHCTGTVHKRNCQKDSCIQLLVKFHEIFTNLPPEQQSQQIYFNISKKKMTCLPCCQGFRTFVEILNHLGTGKHYNNVAKLYHTKPQKKGKAKKTINKEATVLGSFPEAIMELVYANLEQHTFKMNGLSYFYMQNRNRTKYCLLCRKSVANVAEHIKSEDHSDKQGNIEVLLLVQRYHVLFLNVPEPLQYNQIYFQPQRNSVQCLTCSKSCSTTSELTEHLQSDRHYQLIACAEKDDNLRSQEEIEESPLNAYTKRIINTIYLNLTQYNVGVNNFLYLYMQRRSQAYYCLICRETLALLSDVDVHNSSDKHVDNYMDLSSLQMVSRYHEVFTRLSPEHQAQQIYFELHVNNMVCLPCGELCPYLREFVRNHLRSADHNKQITIYEASLKNTKSRKCNSAANNEEPLVVPPPLTYASTNVEDTYINCSLPTTWEHIAEWLDKCNIANDNSAKTVGVSNTDLLIERSDSTYCIVCERKTGEDHLTTKKHIKKCFSSQQLSEKYLTYVTKWNELGAAYKKFRNCFLPASSTLTFCLKCGLNVEYNKLESHLLQFHGETSYGLSEKLDVNFRSPTTRYPQSILDTYFKSNIPQCNIVVDSISYPPLLNMTRGLFCLLCRILLKENIFTHFISELHLTALEERKRRHMFLQYHDTWTAAPIKYQQQIAYFIIYTSNAFFCTLCGTGVPSKKLQLHIDSPQHVAALEQFTRANNNMNLNEIDTDMRLTIFEDDYSKSQLDSTQNTSPLEGRALADVNSDLSERKAVVPLIISTSGPSTTQQKLRRNTLQDERNSFDNCSVLIEGLESEPLAQGNSVIEDDYLPGHPYPRKANDFARKLHHLDVDIMQSTSNGKLFCLLCQAETKDVVTHTSLLQHEVKASNSSADVELVRIFHKEWRKVDIFQRWLEATFFPVALTLAFCKKCGFNVEYSCLNSHLTRCHNHLLDIEFQLKLDKDFRFTSKKEYSTKVYNTLYKDNVPQCDVILEDVSYPVIQTLDDNLRCLLCRKKIIGCQYKHLNSTEHISNAINIASRKRLKSYHDTWLDGDEAFQMQQIYFEKDRDFYCKICVLDLNAAELREHIMGNLHTFSLNKFLINKRFLNKPNIFHDIEVTPQPETNKIHMQSPEHSHLSEQHTSDSETEDSDDDAKIYPESLLEEYYPDFDKYHLTMDNIRYPIFRNTVAGCVCMICKRSPRIFSSEAHIEKSSHKSRLTNLTRQSKLQRFHNVWMKQSFSVQQHQKYFNQSKCLACSVLVDYDNIAAHVQSELHLLAINSPLNFTLSELSDSKESLNASFNVSNSSTPAKSRNVQNVDDAVNLSKPLSTTAAAPKSKKKQSLHSIKKSILNLNSSNIVDKIPLRYSNHAKFLIIDKMNNIFCNCCSKKLTDDMVNIKEHLDSVNHLSLSRVPKQKMKYFCEVCNKHYSMESSWDNHLIDLTHTARFTNLGKTRKERITEYECSTCSLVIYGDEISLQRHNAIYQKRKTKELTLPKPVLQLLSSKSFIDENSKKLLAEASEASHNQEKERQVCVALVKVLKEVFPMCKAYPFGSRVTGLGYSDSDLDVFLDTGNMYQGNHHQGAEEQANIVAIVAKTLQKHKLSFTDINKVAGARTPIVQVFHKDSNIDCDISFRHGLSVENTAFISLCLDLQNILRPTMLYLKEWYVATNISGLSSYALTMLMIFYLQTTGYLLSVRELRLINAEKGTVIDGWETIKYTTSLQKMREFVNRCDYNVDQLMYNFFEYYAKFDFEKWVICPLMGYLVAKTQFNGNGIALPPEMAKYVQKLNATDPEYFRNLTPMCVQDPFDLSHNLTKAFSKDMLKKFQIYCGLSKNHLSALN